jgi:hypothetical protein
MSVDETQTNGHPIPDHGFNGTNGFRTSSVDEINGSSAHESTATVPIAICGIGLRLPGSVDSPNDFFDLLVNKSDARKTIPSNRLDIDSFYSPTQKPGSINFTEGYFFHLNSPRRKKLYIQAISGNGTMQAIGDSVDRSIHYRESSLNACGTRVHPCALNLLSDFGMYVPRRICASYKFANVRSY